MLDIHAGLYTLVLVQSARVHIVQPSVLSCQRGGELQGLSFQELSDSISSPSSTLELDEIDRASTLELDENDRARVHPGSPSHTRGNAWSMMHHPHPALDITRREHSGSAHTACAPAPSAQPGPWSALL
eukprot:2201305-Rhodomonas_salina.1